MEVYTILNKIEKLLDKGSFKTVYMELGTDEDRYILEKNNKRPMGFRGEIEERPIGFGDGVKKDDGKDEQDN